MLTILIHHIIKITTLWCTFKDYTLQLPKWLVWKFNNIDATNEFCQPPSIGTIFEIEVNSKIVNMYDIVLTMS
jgi:hypothetical protein